MQTIDDIEPGTTLTRIDINAPVVDGTVRDNKRFERHAETLERLAQACHAVPVLAHQGRPGRKDFTTLEQHAAILDEKIDAPVQYHDALHSQQTREAIKNLEAGEILVLENVRFSSEELTCQDPKAHAETILVNTLSAVVDQYMNDAFSTAHRPHASLTGFAPKLDTYAGPVMDEEVSYTTQLRDKNTGNTVMLVGGSKPADIVPVMDHCCQHDDVDTFLLGGVIGKLYRQEQGHTVGEDSLLDDVDDDIRAKVQTLASEYGDRIEAPRDFAKENDGRVSVPLDNTDTETTYLDIGDKTIKEYQDYIDEADTVFVKGAPGVFEEPSFARGTQRLLSTIADTDGFTVVGGGDTANALKQLGISDKHFDHVSIAGGAYIKSLIGEDLAAVQALERFS